MSATKLNVRLVSQSCPWCTARRCPVTHDPHSGHWPALVSGLSDVSPQQNDNEIYNAAFSLSHNLRILTLLQPSPQFRDRHQSFRLEHIIFTQALRYIRHLTVHVNTNQESKLFEKTLEYFFRKFSTLGIPVSNHTTHTVGFIAGWN